MKHFVFSLLTIVLVIGCAKLEEETSGFYADGSDALQPPEDQISGLGTQSWKNIGSYKDLSTDIKNGAFGSAKEEKACFPIPADLVAIAGKPSYCGSESGYQAEIARLRSLKQQQASSQQPKTPTPSLPGQLFPKNNSVKPSVPETPTTPISNNVFSPHFNDVEDKRWYTGDKKHYYLPSNENKNLLAMFKADGTQADGWYYNRNSKKLVRNPEFDEKGGFKFKEGQTIYQMSNSGGWKGVQQKYNENKFSDTGYSYYYGQLKNKNDSDKPGNWAYKYEIDPKVYQGDQAFVNYMNQNNFNQPVIFNKPPSSFINDGVFTPPSSSPIIRSSSQNVFQQFFWTQNNNTVNPLGGNNSGSSNSVFNSERQNQPLGGSNSNQPGASCSVKVYYANFHCPPCESLKPQISSAQGVLRSLGVNIVPVTGSSPVSRYPAMSINGNAFVAAGMQSASIVSQVRSQCGL